ncbi:hypothetical protein MBLNU457_7731t1 [Dothideomycetes sp. NU457]
MDSTPDSSPDFLVDSLERCDQVPTVFGIIFCDNYQVVIHEETDTFCSHDGLYCKEAFEGQCIEAIRIQVATFRSELLGIRDVMDNANNYATSRADHPGQLSFQQSQLKTTPLSLKTFSNRREFLVKECQAFSTRAQYLRNCLAQKGLARPMTPVVDDSKPSNAQQSIIPAKTVGQHATETSFGAAAVRRSDRLTGKRRVSYNDQDDNDDNGSTKPDTQSSFRADTYSGRSPVDYGDDSPKPKSRRRSASNRIGGATRRRREPRAATKVQKNTSGTPQQPPAAVSALERQQNSLLESQRLMASFSRTPSTSQQNQSQSREINSRSREYAHHMMASHMNPAAEVLRRAQTTYSPTGWQQPRTAFRPLMYFGNPTSTANASNQYPALPQGVDTLPRQLNMGGMANRNAHGSFPQLAPPATMASLQAQTSMPDPFVEQQPYSQVDPRKILKSHRSF